MKSDDPRALEDRLIAFKDDIYKKRAELAEEKEEESSRMLSFQPTISPYHSKNDTSQLNMSKWEELHRSSNKANKRDLVQDEIDLAKGRDEFTFQPNNHKFQTQSARREAFQRQTSKIQGN